MAKKEEKPSFIPVDKIETKKDIPPIKEPLSVKTNSSDKPVPTGGDLELNEATTRGKIQKPSLSNYKEPELMPMREKEVLSRQDQKAKKLVESDAKREGIKLNWGDNPTYNYGKVINPSTPKPQTDNTEQSSKNLQSNDPAIAAKGFMGLKGKAPQEAVTELDNKQLLEDAKKQRKARWGDALTGFGQVMQGKTVNTDNWESSKMQRKRDEQFKEYKDIVSKNQKVKEVWDAKNREDLISFLETQKKTRELTQREEMKLAQQLAEKQRIQANSDRDYKERVRTNNSLIASRGKTSSGGTQGETSEADIPFEYETVLGEMDAISGKTSGAPARNLQRFKYLSPESKKAMLELANKMQKLRQDIALNNELAGQADKTAEAKVKELKNKMDEYVANMNAILLSKAPETPATASAAATTTTSAATQPAATTTQKPATTGKPKQVKQNGVTYTLNETTGEYE